jgi:hypothetical protein
MAGREKSSQSLNSFQALRDEKNRRFVSCAFKGTRKLNIAFAPLEKL